MRSLHSSILISALALSASLATAHGPGSERAEFTPAPDGMSFTNVMSECVKAIDPAEARLQSGLGDARYSLVTIGPGSEQAALFYSQGFTLQYAFDFPDAILAFNKAISLDPGAAMPYWGLALSAASNINSDATNGCNRLSFRASQVALVNARSRLNDPTARAHYSVDQLERELRYAEAFASQYERVGEKVVISDMTYRRYIERLKNLSEKFVEDSDAAVLYANALLNVTPWEWWSGTAAAGNEVTATAEAKNAIDVLNRILMQNPRHSGANHFYLHAIEQSPFSDHALANADLLPKLAPAAGHFVHMASHIYQRTGDNAAASAANYAAVAVDRARIKQSEKNSLYPLHYLGHNIHFLSWTLSIEGRREESLNMAEELVLNTRTFATDDFLCRQFAEEIKVKSDYFFAVPFFFGTRFEAWDYIERMAGEVKAANESINQSCRAARPDWQDLEIPFSRTMLAYSRAYRALEEPGEAGLRALREYWMTVRAALSATPALKYGNNSALELFRIANVILLDRALSVERDPAVSPERLVRQMEEAVGDGPAAALVQDLASVKGERGAAVLKLLRLGVGLQDALHYNEPPDWYFSTRETLGYALLARNQPGEAERVFMDDLVNNRKSGRSLAGLERSLTAQKKPVPDLLHSQLAEAWRNATVSAIPER